MQKLFSFNEINFDNCFKTTKEDENFRKTFLLVFGDFQIFNDKKGNELYLKDSEVLNNYKTTFDFVKEKSKNINKKGDVEIRNDKLVSFKNKREISIHKNEILNHKNSQTLFEINKLKKDINRSLKKQYEQIGGKSVIHNIREEEKITNINNNSKSKTKEWIRGPYKKKKKNIIKVKTDGESFPFTRAKGLLKMNNFKLTEDIEDRKNNEKNKDKIIEFETNTFKIEHFFIDEEGKKKKAKKKRKYKSDDIRKKIKVKFHKALKKIINQNLKNAGSEELLSFLPQAFMGNISKKFNNKYMNITYGELLSIDFINFEEADKTSENEQKQYIKNKKFLEYMEKYPEISKNSGFDKIKNMKYRDIYKAYLLSNEFENDIIQLKNKNENDDYINSFIMLAESYINYFCKIKKEID